MNPHYLDRPRDRAGRPASVRSIASAASARPPPALRLGPGARSLRAHAHVTLVCAHGDAVPVVPSALSPQGLRRSVSGASPVEEALSRQLDRDTAGQHLSLRSRRSSAATLASIRTDYASNHLAPQAEEEEQLGGSGAGLDRPRSSSSASSVRRFPPARSDTRSSASPHPSELLQAAAPSHPDATKLPPKAAPATPVASASAASTSTAAAVPSTSSRPVTPPRHTLPSGAPSVATSQCNSPSRKVNPKASSAWLRWSSPAPTFPKKDKGKAREDQVKEDPQSVANGATGATMPPLADATLHTVPPSAPSPQPARGRPSSPQPAQPPLAPGQSRDLPTFQATPKGSEPQAQSHPQHHSSHTSRALDASQSSTVRDEAEVSVLLPAEPATKPTLATAPMESSPPAAESLESGNERGGKPDPSLEAPPASRGWRIPFWSSAEPKPEMKAEPKASPGLAPERQPPDDEPKAVGVADPSTKGGDNSNDVSRATTPTVVRPATANGNAKLDRKDDVHKSIAKAVPAANSAAPTKPRVAAVAPTAPAAEVTPSEPQPHPSDTTTESSADPPPVLPTPTVGWGTYLASFVYSVDTNGTAASARPPKEPPRNAANDQDKVAAVEPTKPPAPPAQDQSGPPLLAPPIPLDQPISPLPQSKPQVTPSQPRTPALPDSAASSPSAPPKLASSTSSGGGWLSYLAFRASQKRITGSVVASDEARKSGETAREEVMDFSADPDFPSSTAEPARPAALADAAPPKAESVKAKVKPADKALAPVDRKDSTCKTAKGRTVDKGSKPADKAEAAASIAASDSKMAQPATKQVAPKQPQSLAQSARRQSNASSQRSTAGVIPAPSSTVKTSSALPPPPQAASKQPHLIIPSFETTFDRPPRSLQPRTAQDGMTATAWRALSYVVGVGNKDPVGETRGLKEGRDVGANLPRRIGLGNVGTPDDGWRNVRRVVVVGVHGWFPARLLNSVIGEPTGTSVKFANMMGEAVKKFFKEKGVDSSEIRLTHIPLEGEGVIDDRVDKLYKAYLSNPAWINDLRRADAILFAAHSQGCIVTTHLISRMIAQGHIRTAHNRDAVARCEWAFGPIAIVPSEDSKKGKKLAAGLSGAEGGRQKVAMLGMCGVHLGPFLSISTSSVIGPYLTWFENAAARELFEFQDTESAVSQAYQRSLAMILDNEVRVLLLASLNDQVVPIYGASFSAATHPLLLRALFVDGASYSASDFMTNLICFAFMLRNAGIDDQRLVEHLSEATAGSLTGVGHSTPYEELGCYSLAVNYLFHAGPAAQPLPPLDVESFSARDSRNDFELPWIMRALVDSPEVKDLFPDELRDLKESIHTWKPTTKPLREIKKRLEPMAGRPPRRHAKQLSGSGSQLGPSTSSGPGGAPPTPSKAQPHHVPHYHPHATGTSSLASSAGSVRSISIEPTPHKKATGQGSRLSSTATGWADSQALGTRR